MLITRRQFIKYVSATAAALGLSQQAVEQAIKAIANPSGLKVIWLSGQACGGCIEAASNMFIGEADVTDANGDNIYDSTGIAQVKALLGDPDLVSSTTVEDVIIDVIDLKLMPVVDTPSGDLWTSVLYKYMNDPSLSNNFVVVVEGSIPTDLNMDYVDYCIIGNKYWDSYKVLGIGEAIVNLANNGALAFIAYGTCASYGNVPAAKNRKYIPGIPPKYEHTFAMGVEKYLRSKGINTPVVNIPNCPGHPEALALTVVDVLTQGLAAVAGNLDRYGRPKSSLTFGFPLYSHTIHQDCPRLNAYNKGVFSKSFGERKKKEEEEDGCLEMLGCQGQWVNAPCHTLGWNRQYSRTSCIKAGIPCFGCSEPGYPDRTLQYKY